MTLLEKTSHTTVIVVCCVALGLLLEHRFSERTTVAAKPATEKDLVGRPLKLPEVDWSSTPAAIVLQISATCHFCQESLPLYKTMSSTRQTLARRVPVIVVSSDPLDMIKGYLAGTGLVFDKVLHVTPDATGASATPIIFATGPGGVVKRVFIGKLETSREKDVLSLLENGA